MPLPVEDLMTIPKLRVARPTDNIEVFLPFYKEGLGFDVLYNLKVMTDLTV